MDTNEHASSQRERGVRTGCGNRLELTGIRSLKTPGPGAVAHMSLHQKPTMSKSRRHNEADNYGAPIYTGGPVVRLCWRPIRMEPVETGSTASVSGHIWAVLSRVNRLLQFYFAALKTRGNLPFSTPSTYVRCRLRYKDSAAR
jgi:hypothetical protein